MATLETRRAQLSDASIMSRLTLELGYDCTEVLMRQRFARLRDDPSHAVFVAALDGERVVGWVHVEARMPLWSDPFAEIMGLVVSVHQHRMGVGRALVERAMAWADSRGIGDLRAEVQLHREAAHDFFESLGFELSEERQVWRRVAQGVELDGHITLVD
ncbi:MAG: GNAT family N-acetyltransferase [Myxococcales bacterium]|nr:GNAT family N-acetyltransferase [Myxococcales bacterium]MCB9718998.1 GNAT family N-acetyltransferase [Myxococcales bacterium]